MASDPQHLSNQLCVRLHTASRLMTRAYRPMLEPLGLTYPQYMVLMALWSGPQPTRLKALGEQLHLDSGTLSPLLRKLVAKGLVERTEDPDDARAVALRLTREGRSMKERLACIPASAAELSPDAQLDVKSLQASLDQLIARLEQLS